MVKEKTKERLVIGRAFHSITLKQGKALIHVIETKFCGKRPETADDLVKEAQKKTSPIHSLFEWNNAVAAAAQRRERATYLLRAIKVVRVSVKTGAVVTKPVNFEVAVKYKSHKVEQYVPPQRLWDNPDDVNVVMDRAIQEFRTWFNRYKGYAEFLELFDPIIKEFVKLEKVIEAKAPWQRKKKAG